MTQVLDQMLKIRRFRQEQAELQVGRERRELLLAQERREDAERILKEYREQARKKENEMFDDLCSRTVRVRDLENVQQNVAELRDGERDRGHKREEASAQETQAQDTLEQARVAHIVTIRQYDKFYDLTDTYRLQEQAVQDGKEELEMEEVASQGWRPRTWNTEVEDIGNEH